MLRGAFAVALVSLARCAACVHIVSTDPRHHDTQRDKEGSGRHRATSIKAYYVNKKSSTERKDCMEAQLQRLQKHLARVNVHFSYVRWPAILLGNCTDTSSCMRAHPMCFPSGKAGKLGRTDAKDEGAAVRGVIGNWCAHLNLLRHLDSMHQQGKSHADYFFILEDDLIMDVSGLVESMARLLKMSKRTWPLIAFDTFGNQAKDLAKNIAVRHAEGAQAPAEDLVAGGLQLYSISHAWGYWGAHAWLLDALHVGRLTDYYAHLHTMPLDWVPKVVRPLHLGMMAYQTGAITQRNLMARNVTTSTLNQSCLAESYSDILGVTTDLHAFTEPFSDVPGAVAKLNAFTDRRGTLGLDKLARRPRPGTEFDDVVILGMHNSGTNLLYSMFHHYVERGTQHEYCKGYARKGYCGDIWRHINPNRLRLFDGTLDRTLAIILVRHPLSQLRFLQASPYLTCGNSRLTEPCRCKKDVNVTAGPIMSQVPRPLCDTDDASVPCWQSLVGGWNSHAAGYHELDRLFKRVLIVRYEDLVESPADVLRQIEDALNVTSKLTMTNKSRFLTAPSRLYAVKALRAPSYRTELSRAELKNFCGAIDKGHLFRLGYHGCQDFHDSVYNHVFYEFDV